MREESLFQPCQVSYISRRRLAEASYETGFAPQDVRNALSVFKVDPVRFQASWSLPIAAFGTGRYRSCVVKTLKSAHCHDRESVKPGFALAAFTIMSVNSI